MKDMVFSTTLRGNEMVLYQGFEYTKYRVNKAGMISWRCRGSIRDKCPAVLKMSDKHEVIGKPPTHSHESNPIKAEASMLKQRMKKAVKDEGASPNIVISEMLQGVSPHVLNKLPQTASLARVLSRVNGQSEKKVRAIPTTSEFPIPPEYADLILHDTGDTDPNRILAVGDVEMLSYLNQDLLFGDGTYDHSPEMLFYLFTFHSKVGNSHPPCLYFLLRHNDMNSYMHMFDILKHLCPKLKPSKVLVDLSRPCMVAARDAFPRAVVQSTYFHLMHTMLVTIQAVGLKNEYDVDVDAKLALKSLAAMAFVPPSDVDALLNEIATTFPAQDQRYLDVINYFVVTYVVGEKDRGPIFPVDVWNHYEAAAEMSPKSSNCCALYHNVLNAMFHQTRQNNVWSMLMNLKKDIEKHKCTSEKVFLGHVDALKGNKCRQLALQLATHVNAYDNETDKLEYLRALANMH